MHRSTHRRGSWKRLLVFGALLASLAAPGGAIAAAASTTTVTTTTTYSISGLEVWPTPYAATFVGTAQSDTGTWGGWRARIDHSGVISPTGWIGGGYAELFSGDLTTVRGTFSGGTITLIGGSETECVTMTHAVSGTLVDVVRPGVIGAGTGTLTATLTHYRLWVFGRCITYSASASGSIALTF